MTTANRRTEGAKKLAESEGFQWEQLAEHERGVFLGRMIDQETGYVYLAMTQNFWGMAKKDNDNA